MFGACGKSGCKACSTSTLAACWKPDEFEDTCCLFLAPPHGRNDWRLGFVPWYEMRGKTCEEYTGAADAEEMKMECCKKSEVSLGQTKEYNVATDSAGCVRERS
eukprot:TRINITY_DN17679_c0_g2_i1.p2 TRINITY_DN17679_c0_g2~~TRINITY_DN17679_c0_g2_i1.p2  ORF type:complete len:104 (-),score=15.77 TRINITY_DN17679_c0_g2_i1:67-378(-)